MRAHALHAAAGLAVSAIVAALAGCNPYLEHYEGERFAPVDAARIVEATPADDRARLIGASEFRTSDTALRERHVLEAACAVGADLATWSVKWDGRETQVDADPIMQRGISERGTFATYVPVVRTHDAWKHVAHFYRSNGAAHTGAAGTGTVSAEPVRQASPGSAPPERLPPRPPPPGSPPGP